MREYNAWLAETKENKENGVALYVHNFGKRQFVEAWRYTNGPQVLARQYG